MKWGCSLLASRSHPAAYFLSTQWCVLSNAFTFKSQLILKTDTACPIFSPGYDPPAQLDQGTAKEIRSWKETMELQTVGAHLLQRERTFGDKYGGCAPQGVYGTRRPGRSGAARRGRGNLVSVTGRFIVVPHRTAHQTARANPFQVPRVSS